MKVALIHDHITQYGGAERVLFYLSEIYPDAPIYTVVSDPNITKKYFSKHKIINSGLQKYPLSVSKVEWFLPLMPYYFEQFDLSQYDIVISSSSIFSKGVITQPSTMHICYCHTPPRFLWHYSDEYIKNAVNNGTIRKLIPKFLVNKILKRLKRWDFQTAQRVDYFIANSKNVQSRIRKYYNRDSEVHFPPTEIEKYYDDKESNYYLIGGRLVAHKKFDLAIKAFQKLKNKKLLIFGDGPELKKLEKLSRRYRNIKLLGPVDEKQKVKLFSKARAFLYPQEEDAGITAIEALASGTPVIGLNKGGLTEVVSHKETGFLYDDNSVTGLVNAIKESSKIIFNTKILIESSRKHSVSSFKERVKRFVDIQELEYREMIKISN